MTEITDFIAELIRAANTISDVCPYERQRLLSRGLATVEALKDMLEVDGNVVLFERSSIREIETFALTAPDTTDDIIATCMLNLANEIRRLRVLLRELHDASITPGGR